MISHKGARLLAVATATALLVLVAPVSAAAQCSNPDYKGSRSFPGGACPENVAGIASGAVWALLVLAAGLWLASALRRSRSETATDLTTIDSVFGAASNEEAGAVGRRESDDRT
ncbi:hypothetical protein [Streptomyces chryseus]|uniref:hypothetical protein n=1 Tax=Streptomyces chryseus TaxID=68186 RepID=UPI00110F6F83|nr:hypothetical protein [Streptomyces chryseus]GGX23621.1 hypothetical protein GCM10010353_43320 [Streptomyces chryseus]